ncbi:MAG: M20/M25/M40 family metallo-hydrolase [Desulfovibrio sp.]|jgi:glutamate carboxypeptidase|nr:M20/M25/M40 family metallo-hydrolase [Desulfovibrio sp.]
MPRALISRPAFLLTLTIAAVLTLTSPLQAQAANPNKKVLELCEQAKPQIVNDLEKLVNMDSGSNDFPELLKKQEVLVEMLKKIGGDVKLVPGGIEARKATNNIVATWKGEGKARIMYMNHYDTVWNKGDAEKRPFKIENNVAYGPGVSDSQPNLLAAINLLDILLNKLGEKNFDTITVMFNCDEEIGSFASRDLITDLASKHDVVYSLDGGGPGGNTLTISARGTAYYRMHIKGKESHSGSAPEKGVNAGYEMAHQILQMRDLGNKELGTDVNWTIGQFGTKSNVIPGAAWAEANVRTSKLNEWDRIEKDMSERIKNKLLPETEITIDFRRGRPPFEKNPITDALAAKAIKLYKDELDKDVIARASGGGTDSNYSSQKAPALEGFGFGGSGGHSVDEQFPLDNIVPRLYLLVRVSQETMKGDMVPLAKK